MRAGPLKNEFQLVKDLSNGNILAFNTLFEEYGKRLYRFAYGYLKSEEESEELVQEVFTRVWEKRADLKKELSFKSYLFTISFNIIRKQFIKRSQYSEYFNSRLSLDFDLQTSESITYNSLLNYVIDLVEQLPARRREIFIKSRLEGMSISEISNQLHVSHKTVENQITNALKFIRDRFGKEDLYVLLFFYLFIH